jgi:type I restriction enzyme S subunit
MRYEVPYLPPLAEQQTIAATLSALDDKIANNRGINNCLELMAQAIFKSWFVDFEPKYTHLGDVCQCVLGGTPSRVKPEYWGGSVPWINSGMVNEFRITEPSEWITELGLRNSATKLLPAKTTVLAITGATLGQVSLLEITACANQSVVGIVPNENLPYTFVYPFIVNSIDELVSHQTGGAQQHINKQNIENLIVPHYAAEVVVQYDTVVAPLFEKISNNCFESVSLAALRDLLLPRLMSGELSAADVDAK